MAAGEITHRTSWTAGLARTCLTLPLVALLGLAWAGIPPAVGAPLRGARAALARRPAVATVAAPSWWKGGPCDTGDYPGSHPLGAQWHGLVACGPGPTQGGEDHLVSFFPGAWGEFEWECVELSMRWMYQAWGVNPYPADGYDVVSDYNLPNDRAAFNPDGPQLLAVDNGTPGAAPEPGDVISVARTLAEPLGHTAVVTASAVDARGDGTITVIQQNGGPGNDGWASYPVENWLVGGNVSGWLHDPAWSFQRPVIGYTGPNGFEARIAAPGNTYELEATSPVAVAVAGGAGPVGTFGGAAYGYVDKQGDFLVKRAGASGWRLAASDVRQIAMAMTSTGTPVVGYLDDSGEFYAREGSLTGSFTLEATGVSEIAIAAGGGGNAPLLGYLSTTGAFLVKRGLQTTAWTVVQASGAAAIALAEGSGTPGALLGYLSTGGVFLAKSFPSGAPWTEEATGVGSISLAVIGPRAVPLLGYLSQGSFYAAETLTPKSWREEASGVTEAAVAAGPCAAALPILGFLTSTGNVELSQGTLTGPFSLQGRNGTSLALSSITES